MATQPASGYSSVTFEIRSKLPGVEPSVVERRLV